MHNSGWVQSPGKVALEDPAHWPRLEIYVKAVVSRFKDDAREVNAGYECGIGLSDFQDLKQGDIIETYEDREIPRS